MFAFKKANTEKFQIENDHMGNCLNYYFFLPYNKATSNDREKTPCLWLKNGEIFGKILRRYLWINGTLVKLVNWPNFNI